MLKIQVLKYSILTKLKMSSLILVAIHLENTIYKVYSKFIETLKNSRESEDYFHGCFHEKNL